MNLFALNPPWLTPAIRLINRLRYPQKFALISLCFLLPLGLAVGLLLSEIQSQIQFAQTERLGLAYLQPLEQVHQGLLLQSLINDETFWKNQANRWKWPLAQAQQASGQRLGTEILYQSLTEKLSDPISIPEALAAIGPLRQQVGNQSKLILDPDLDSYYLMEALLIKLPAFQDALAQLQAIVQTAQPGKLSPLQESQTVILTAQLHQLQTGLNTNLGVAFAQASGPQVQARLVSPLTPFSLALQTLTQTLDHRLVRPSSEIDRLLASQTEWSLLASMHLGQALRPALDDLLTHRIHYFQTRQLGLSLFVLATLAIAVYLFLGFYGGVMGTVASLSQAAQKMVQGTEDHETASVMLPTQDEMAAVVQSFNTVADALRSAEAQYRDIFESAVVGMYQTSLTGQYLRANPMLAQIYGYESPQALIKTLTDIQTQLYVQGDRRQQFRDIMNQNGKVWGFESQVYKQDGSIIWISEAARILTDDHGLAIGYEGTVVDISQRKADEAEIERLTQRLKNENLRLEAEIDITRQLQQMLMPTDQELASVSGLDIAGFTESATEVGGDYYDIVQTNGQTRFSIGDVTGHGLESSLVMIMAQTALRTLLEHGETDAGKILNAINRTLYENTRRMGSLKNMTLAVLQYEAGLLRLSGQHEELILIRHTGAVEQIDTFELGFPLGLEADITDFVGEREITLEPGDVAVLYTDGITEAMNDRREFYGLERLQSVLREHRHQSAEALRQAVITDLRAFVGSEPLTDDITLLILKQQSPVESMAH